MFTNAAGNNITVMILNNSDAEINTMEKFLTAVRGWGVATARVIVIGGFVVNNVQYMAYTMDVTSTAATIYGFSLVDGARTTADFTSLTFYAIHDGVNIIN